MGRKIFQNTLMCRYSITSRSSFSELAGFYAAICAAKNCLPKVVLVGAKVDLEFERQVPVSEGLKYAKELQCKFYEVQ